MSRQPLPEAASQIALPWIVRLRYGMVCGQLATILIVRFFFGVDLPLGWIVLGPLVIACSNYFLAARVSDSGPPRRPAISTLVEAAFVLDALGLTAVLMLSGGPTNPFSLLYLVHITLAATILTKQQTWILGGLSIVCFALLFWIYRPIPVLEMHQHTGGANLHLAGMWVGFAVATFLVAVFSGKISEVLREREASLLRMQEELARKDRLASLATLAAGAAHELNTPLATIAIVAKELELYAMRTTRDPAVADDSQLIRTEVERCREILWRMSVQGAEPAALSAEHVEAAALIDAVRSELPETGRLAVQIADSLPALTIPRRAVEQALIALLRNAFQASASGAQVDLQAREANGNLQFIVRDRGCGMTPETLRRIGEPFFTTREPGKGMGLGTFLVRTLAEQLGGRLTFESAPGAGTAATFELPLMRVAESATVHV